MDRLIARLYDLSPSDILTDTEIKHAVSGSSNRRYGLVKRALAEGSLIRFRRGLYGYAPKYRRNPINLYEISHKIYYPSYISLESAFAYYGLIPEAVYATTSVCLKRSRTFETPAGIFTYATIPGYHLHGVERLTAAQAVFFMATPEKAVLDYVHVYKKNWTGFEPLRESLRIEEEQLKNFSVRRFRELAMRYRSRRCKNFVRGLLGEQSG